jgi:hypothetical protein
MGNTAGSPWSPVFAPTGFPSPWFQHTHKFDIEPVAAPRGQTVRFLGAHRNEARLHETLEYLRTNGDPNLRLELLRNDSYSGMGRYTLDLGGTVTTGIVRTGFPNGSGGFSRQTQTFRASQLRQFDLEVRSLQMLRRLWDSETAGCTFMGYTIDSYPICVSLDRNRHNAMVVRLVNADTGRPVYESSVYWHMQEAEAVADQAAHAALMAQITAGAAAGNFGTRLEMGSGVRLRFNLDHVRALAPRLGFDQPEAVQVDASTVHWEPGQPGAPAPSRPTAGGLTAVCHNPGRSNQQTKYLEGNDLQTHLGHGDTLGACSSGSGGSGGSGSGGSGSGGGGDD